MHKIIGKIALAFIFIAAAGASQVSAQVLGELLNRIDAHSKSIKTLKAKIKRATLNPSLNETTTREGSIMFIAKSASQKDHLLRLDWENPTEIMSVAGGKFIAYNPKTNIAHTGAANAKKAEEKGSGALAFLSMSKKELQDNYTGEIVAQETLDAGNLAVFHLKFTPKGPSKYKYAELWVDADGMVHQARVSPKSGDDDLFRLSGIQKNPTLNVKDFTVKLPKETKIINV